MRLAMDRDGKAIEADGRCIVRGRWDPDWEMEAYPRSRKEITDVQEAKNVKQHLIRQIG